MKRKWSLKLILVAFILIKLITPTQFTFADEWTLQNPLPTVNPLRGVWGSSKSDVFFVGDYGTILHYNGSTWSPMSSGITNLNSLPNSLRSVWGSSGTDVFAVGSEDTNGNGTILHYDGSTWSPMSSGTTTLLSSVWGSSGTDVFAVGNCDTIIHYNGSTWSPMSSGITDCDRLSSVWGSSGSDVFAVGGSFSGLYGTILHYNGSTWSPMSSGITNLNSLSCIWGSSGSDVFAVGYNGTILHYNGSTWSPMSPPLEALATQFISVWGSSGTDVFAVGDDNGTIILHYNGSTWSSVSSGITNLNSLSCIWGSSGSDVFAVGGSYSGLDGTILHYNGSTWSSMISGTTFPGLSGVWGSSGTDVFAVGADYDYDDYGSHTTTGTILHYNGSTWSTMTSGTTGGLSAVWGSSGSDVFAVGGDVNTNTAVSTKTAIILHYNGSTWSPMSPPLEAIETQFSSVWGSSGTDVFAVGSEDTSSYGFYTNTAVILHYNGSTWSSMAIPVSEDIPSLTQVSCIWGSSGSDVFAVGPDDNGGGTILHYNGSTWSTMQNVPNFNLTGIWGSSGTDVFAVSDRGIILHYDGSTWSAMATGQTFPGLSGVWGSSKSDVFFVGGAFIHYNGSTWSPMAIPVSYLYGISGVWGSSKSDVFAVGGYGIILHYAGAVSTTTVPVTTTTSTPGGTTSTTTVCPAALLLEGDNNNLTLLRKFRDTVLLNDPSYRKYVPLFYKHAPELSMILMTNPGIMAQAQDTLQLILPAIQSIAEGKELSLTPETCHSIESVLNSINTRTTPDLHEELTKLKKDFSDRKLFPLVGNQGKR